MGSRFIESHASNPSETNPPWFAQQPFTSASIPPELQSESVPQQWQPSWVREGSLNVGSSLARIRKGNDGRCIVQACFDSSAIFLDVNGMLKPQGAPSLKKPRDGPNHAQAVQFTQRQLKAPVLLSTNSKTCSQHPNPLKVHKKLTSVQSSIKPKQSHCIFQILYCENADRLGRGALP